MKTRRRKRNRKARHLGLFILFTVSAIAIGLFLFLFLFRIENVTVEGNIHYTDEEIQKLVMDGYMSENSLILSLTKKEVVIEGKQFLESVNVQMTDRNSVRIRVNEKGVIGYVEYADAYWYFDRNGVVVERCTEPFLTVEERIAQEKIEKQQAEDAAQGAVSVVAKLPAPNYIPEVRGFQFKEQLELNKPLPVENDRIFNTLYSINQMMNKEGLRADFVMFDEKYHVYLYFDTVEVCLGQDSYLEDKVITLASIMPEMEGMSGTLHLENYAPTDSGVVFEKSEEISAEIS